MNRPAHLRVGVIGIILLSLFVGVVFAIRCYNREPSGDELLYQYVWEEDDPTDLWTPGHRYERRVSSWADIWQTQVKHYMTVNGRALVHTVEQAFTGHMLAFSIVNTCVFLLLAWLIVCYVAPKDKRGNFLLWLSVYIALLVLFPYQESLWTSVNYGLNYLWPATLAVGVLTVWDRILAGRLPARFNIPVALMAFVFGWTHEAFVVGVAGGMFLYYCFHFRQFRGQVLWLAVPMWISAAIMLFSPGNISRFLGKGGDTGYTSFVRFGNGIGYMLESVLLMAMILGAILLLALGQRKRLVGFIKANARLVIVMATALAFSVVLNTKIRTLTFANLTALFIVLRYVCSLEWRKSKTALAFGTIVLFLFGFHQILIVRDTIANCKYQNKLVKDYINSPDGLVHYNHSFISPFTFRFIRTWEEPEEIFIASFTSVHSGDTKKMILLKDADFKAVEYPDEFFVDSNKVDGNAPVYYGEGGRYFWVKPDALKSGQTLEAELYPVDWDHKNVELLVKVKFVLFSKNYESTMTLDIDTLDSPRYGRLMMVRVPAVRKVKGINIKQTVAR